jgi:predicted MFS family arabinose efflux permease
MIAFALPRARQGAPASPGVVSATGSRSGAEAAAGPGRAPLAANAWATATRIGPWLLALCFLFYAGQFVGIFSFLPSVYADAGAAQSLGALLTALAVIANVAGNLAGGLLLQRGFQRHSLIAFAGVSMALCAWIAFGTEAPFALRYAAIVVLSVVGGLIPGTLFATAPFYAPNPAAVSTTVGLMQQGSASGQILLPPVIAALAQYSGGWSSTWIATGAAAACTVAIAAAIRSHDRKRFARAVAASASGGGAGGASGGAG